MASVNLNEPWKVDLEGKFEVEVLSVMGVCNVRNMCNMSNMCDVLCARY